MLGQSHIILQAEEDPVRDDPSRQIKQMAYMLGNATPGGCSESLHRSHKKCNHLAPAIWTLVSSRSVGARCLMSEMKRAITTSTQRFETTQGV